MNWTNIETYGFWQWLYFIGRIITMKAIWIVSSCLLLFIIKYQSEKPKHEKSSFDYFFTNHVIVAFFVHFWFCMLYVISIYIPIPLKEENCLWIDYISHCFFLLPMASSAVTIYFKMVMVFQPQDIDGCNMKTLSNKAFLWKLVILSLAAALDWLYGITLSSPMLEIFMKKTYVQR